MGKGKRMKRQLPNCGQLGLNRIAVGTPLRHVTPTNRLFLGPKGVLGIESHTVLCPKCGKQFSSFCRETRRFADILFQLTRKRRTLL